jgi:hypothetical protein
LQYDIFLDIEDTDTAPICKQIRLANENRMEYLRAKPKGSDVDLNVVSIEDYSDSIYEPIESSKVVDDSALETGDLAGIEKVLAEFKGKGESLGIILNPTYAKFGDLKLKQLKGRDWLIFKTFDNSKRRSGSPFISPTSSFIKAVKRMKMSCFQANTTGVSSSAPNSL